MYELQDDSVQMVCCSPPYWGLRKYSGEQDLVWGGDSDCEHQWVSSSCPTLVGQQGMTETGKWPAVVENSKPSNSNTCQLCGAWKGSLGLEPTIDMYVSHLIEILREIRRVLRRDGVCFVNLGDSYAGSGSPGGDFRDGKGGDDYLRPYNRQGNNLKAKDLCLIPFRVALAAQSDGWWVRSIIHWIKPNPMPESVTDRPTDAVEYILMLTKSKNYYWDAEAVREAYTEPLNRWGGDKTKPTDTTKDDSGIFAVQERDGRDRRPNPSGRNLRNAWTINTQPYPEAHFAVFPEKIPETCIKAATPEMGCCDKCGRPWVRILEKEQTADCGRIDVERNMGQQQRKSLPSKQRDSSGSGWSSAKITLKGWKPSCSCNSRKPPVPSLVIDPFSGSGTTLWVAKKLNRNSVGYDLSTEYCELAVKRCRQQVMRLNI